jgi:hypothetical protein
VHPAQSRNDGQPDPCAPRFLRLRRIAAEVLKQIGRHSSSGVADDHVLAFTEIKSNPGRVCLKTLPITFDRIAVAILSLIQMLASLPFTFIADLLSRQLPLPVVAEEASNECETRNSFSP